MIHVISFSSGLSSALAAERVLQRFAGKDGHEIHIVFMNTTIEDEDNYRFVDDIERRWIGLYGEAGKVIRLSDGRTPYQVAEDQNIVPNQKVAPCTYHLKIRQFKHWLYEQGRPLTIYVGFDFKELHRTKKVSANYAKLDCEVDFPLLWQPIETRQYKHVCQDDWGIEPPRMYRIGYTHANCGGQCVKQGWGDWLRTLIHFPDRYAWSEEWERNQREKIDGDYAILRDQSANKVRPKTLQQLREEYEAEQARNQGGLFSETMLAQYDSISACVRCSIGDYSEDEDE